MGVSPASGEGLSGAGERNVFKRDEEPVEAPAAIKTGKFGHLRKVVDVAKSEPGSRGASSRDRFAKDVFLLLLEVYVGKNLPFSLDRGEALLYFPPELSGMILM